MSTNPEIMNALALALTPIAAEIPDLQIYAGWLPTPSPPSIEIFPGDPFQEDLGFAEEKKSFWTVRARVAMADTDAGQNLLLQLLEPDGPTSVESALCWNGAGESVKSSAVVEGTPSGYREYSDGDFPGRLLGCEWRVEVLT